MDVTANLQHSNILPLLDSDEADSFLHYVMPFVEGVSVQVLRPELAAVLGAERFVQEITTTALPSCKTGFGSTTWTDPFL